MKGTTGLSPTSPPSPESDRTPDHYRGASCPCCRAAITPKDLMGHLSFEIGSVIKYAFRAGRKPGEPALKDLLKCQDFLNDAIRRERERESRDAGKVF